MKRHQRLKRSREFARLREEGKSHANRSVVVSWLPEPGALTFRAGFITSKRLGIAVRRNLVRRRLRAIVDEFAPRIQRGVIFVTVARARAAKVSFAELRGEWQTSAERCGLLICP